MLSALGCLSATAPVSGGRLLNSSRIPLQWCRPPALAACMLLLLRAVVRRGRRRHGVEGIHHLQGQHGVPGARLVVPAVVSVSHKHPRRQRGLGCHPCRCSLHAEQEGCCWPPVHRSPQLGGVPCMDA